MKKKMIFAVIAAVAAVSGIAGFNAQKHESDVNALALANIEALTDNNEEPRKLPCCPDPTYTGSWSNMVLDCNGCTYRPKYSGSTTSKC